MKVYVLEYDNGEPYEDGMNMIEAAFASSLAALKYAIREGYTKPPTWRLMSVWDEDEKRELWRLYIKSDGEESWWPDSSLTCYEMEVHE